MNLQPLYKVSCTDCVHVHIRVCDWGFAVSMHALQSYPGLCLQWLSEVIRHKRGVWRGLCACPKKERDRLPLIKERQKTPTELTKESVREARGSKSYDSDTWWDPMCNKSHICLESKLSNWFLEFMTVTVKSKGHTLKGEMAADEDAAEHFKGTVSSRSAFWNCL